MTEQKAGPHRVEIGGFAYDLNVPNETLQGAGFYVSYNEQDIDLYWSVTTALVPDSMDRFYILNGDHRAQYAERMADGFDACLDYFLANADHINKRSDRPDQSAIGFSGP